MKNNYLKRIAIVLLINSILFLVYIHFSNINLLEISGNKDVNYYPYLRLAISVIFSIFILLIFIKEYKIRNLKQESKVFFAPKIYSNSKVDFKLSNISCHFSRYTLYLY